MELYIMLNSAGAIVLAILLVIFVKHIKNKLRKRTLRNGGVLK